MNKDEKISKRALKIGLRLYFIHNPHGDYEEYELCNEAGDMVYASGNLSVIDRELTRLEKLKSFL